jgi:DNA-directed RNA polymerase subunit RPC12/RpoP
MGNLNVIFDHSRFERIKLHKMISFRCADCDKRFTSSSNLSEHRTLHTGRMNYECKKCRKRFRLWTTLKKHSLKCTVESEPISMTNLDLGAMVGLDNSQENFQTDQLESLEGSAIYVFDSANELL